jgi:hypothetical protein
MSGQKDRGGLKESARGTRSQPHPCVPRKTPSICTSASHWRCSESPRIGLHRLSDVYWRIVPLTRIFNVTGGESITQPTHPCYHQSFSSLLEPWDIYVESSRFLRSSEFNQPLPLAKENSSRFRPRRLDRVKLLNGQSDPSVSRFTCARHGCSYDAASQPPTLPFFAGNSAEMALDQDPPR